MKKKNTWCTFGLLKDIIMKYEGRNKLYVRAGWGEVMQSTVKEKTEEGVINRKKYRRCYA